MEPERPLSSGLNFYWRFGSGAYSQTARPRSSHLSNPAVHGCKSTQLSRNFAAVYRPLLRGANS